MPSLGGRLARMRRIAAACLTAALLGSTIGCSPAAQPGPGAKAGGAHHGPVNPAPVGEADFGPSTYQVLLSGERDSKRLELLAGVVRHQLDRAGKRFGSGNRAAGVAALTGGQYLIRVGELRPEMLTRAAPALRAGSAEVARVGDEGRAVAYYSMLRQILPPGSDKQDVDAHLAALAKWSASTGTTGPMQAAGNRQRAAINRALVQPTPESQREATQATLQWIKRALDFNASEMPIRSNMEREEAIEAYRAVRAGGATLVALYLRDGDAGGALDALGEGDLLRVVPPGLTERLERAASDDDAAAWADLFTLFDGSNSSDRPETSIDIDVSRAAAWGSALELFRSEPRSMRGAAPLAMKLVEWGMAEVAPLVLSPAIGDKPSTEELSWAMSLVLRAVVAEDEIGDLPAARRTFEAAAPILAVAESKGYVGKLRPSAGRVRYVMGALETRAGELSRALPHVEA